MSMVPKSSNYYFIVFLVVGASALAAIPLVKRAFSQTSDSYLVSRMNQAQAEMFFIKEKSGDFRKACFRGFINNLSFEILTEGDSGLSCTTNPDASQLSLYTRLHSKKVYCVDSLGNQEYINENVRPRGYCSKA